VLQYFYYYSFYISSYFVSIVHQNISIKSWFQLLIDFKCVYRSLCTALCSLASRRVARLLDAVRCVSLWHPCCFVLNALCTRPLFILSFLFFSPAAIFFPFLFTPPLRSADPFFGVLFFQSRQGVGPRQQRMLRCLSSSDPPARLCRGESHSEASLALSPLLPGRLRARFLSVIFRTHSHPFPPLVHPSLFHLKP
jgi:hypothetical protein